jgi:3-deoxy-manno-octulosonate cytidylyltransferase (CMP-KDO synthetase)
MGSKRLPGKPLRCIKGRSLIRHVVRQVLAFDLNAEVVVATDSQEIIDEVRTLVPGYLTSADCLNGTERVANLLFDNPDFAAIDVVVNVQGDQLNLPRSAVVGALKLVEYGLAEIGTAVAPLMADSVFNPNRVKVLMTSYTQQCLAFYRLLGIDLQLWCALGSMITEWPIVVEHVGVYTYTRAVLRNWLRLPPTPLEEALGLEQLRPLEQGMTIKAAWTERCPVVIDTEEDLLKCSVLQTQ